MRTLHRYLTWQVVVTMAMTVAVFTFVLLLGNLLREILTLLVNRQASLWIVIKGVGLLIPYVWVFALPMGMLAAALLVFGRFSADNELTAARANGISLLALITPILLLSLLMCGFCALFNMELAPRCRVAYKQMLFELGSQQALDYLPENSFIRNFPGYIVYVGEKEEDFIRNIYVYQLNDQQQVTNSIRAMQGEIDFDTQTGRLDLNLRDFWVTSELDGKWISFAGGETSVTLGRTRTEPKKRDPKLSEMTFRQLLDERSELEKRLGARLDSGDRARQITTPIEVQLHQQIAFSFASFSFTLIGIPLGIRAHRRETSVGVAISIGLVLVYYGFIVLGETLETRPELVPQLIFWAPNFLFQAIGIVLLWRVNQGR